MITAKGMDKAVIAILIFTLSFSVVSVTGPNYFTNAAAESDEHEHTSVKKEIGEHSHVELELSTETEVEIEINEGDMANADYAVTFKCTEPVISETFPSLHVADGDGELEHHFALAAGTYSGCTLSIGERTMAFDAFTIVEGVSEEDAEEDAHEDEEGSYVNENGNVRIVTDLGENSEVQFKAEKGSARVMVEIEEGDLPDGSYNVAIACASPESSLTFSEKLNVNDGEGEFEGKLSLRSATYSDCVVSAGDLSAVLPDFTIVAGGHTHGHDHGDHKAESRVDVKGDGTVRLEIAISHPGFASGTYDVTLSCVEPAGMSVVFTNALAVDKDGNGKFRIDTSLGPGSYRGCEASIEEESGRMVIATFDTFNVEEEHEDNRTLDEKKKDRKHALLDRIVTVDIHRRHIDAARASSPGDYEPGTAYNLTAAGTVEGDATTVAKVEVDLGVWKSNRAIILMDVLGGNVTVGEDTYTVRIGYAVYSMQNDVLSVRALATDDATGEIVRLKLRGNASSDDAAFPMADGDVMELLFEGNSGRFANQIGNLELSLDGKIEA